MNPLVTIFCLCYNHEKFVAQALHSVFNQTYTNIQVIVLDDGSTDGSVKEIEKQLSNRPDVHFINHTSNMGYCSSLNEVAALTKGEFVIDLSADDILMPTRVEVGVREFLKKGESYGVNFSDAFIINEFGREISVHSQKHPHANIPEGDIYKNLIDSYFICPPTLMFRRSVLAKIGGYDETLAFEDFDFLIRSSREFNYFYTPLPLVKKRILASSMSATQFVRNNPQRWSTYQVCKKIALLNKTIEEQNALKKRLLYECRTSVRLFELRLALKFLKLYFRLSSLSTMLR
ncbi:MAG: glycosyltransferase [Flammeovirgaceae bacterium]